MTDFLEGFQETPEEQLQNTDMLNDDSRQESFGIPNTDISKTTGYLQHKVSGQKIEDARNQIESDPQAAFLERNQGLDESYANNLETALAELDQQKALQVLADKADKEQELLVDNQGMIDSKNLVRQVALQQGLNPEDPFHKARVTNTSKHMLLQRALQKALKTVDDNSSTAGKVIDALGMLIPFQSNIVGASVSNNSKGFFMTGSALDEKFNALWEEQDLNKFNEGITSLANEIVDDAGVVGTNYFSATSLLSSLSKWSKAEASSLNIESIADIVLSTPISAPLKTVKNTAELLRKGVSDPKTGKPTAPAQSKGSEALEAVKPQSAEKVTAVSKAQSDALKAESSRKRVVELYKAQASPTANTRTTSALELVDVDKLSNDGITKLIAKYGDSDLVTQKAAEAIIKSEGNAVVASPELAMRMLTGAEELSTTVTDLTSKLSNTLLRENVEAGPIADKIRKYKDLGDVQIADLATLVDDRLRNVLDFMAKTNQDGDEFIKLVQDQTSAITKKFGSNLSKVNYTNDTLTGERYLTLDLMDGQGRPFNSPNVAQALATDYFKLTPDQFVITAVEGGGHAISAIKHIDELKGISDSISIGSRPLSVNVGRRYAGTIATEAPKTYAKALEAGLLTSKSIKELNKINKDISRNLTKEQYARLDTMARKSMEQEKWFSESDFMAKYTDEFEEAPNKFEIFAYNVYRQVEDLQWQLANINARKDLVRLGMKNVEFPGYRGFGKRVTELNSIPKGHVYDTVKNEFRQLTTTEFDELKVNHEFIKVGSPLNIDGQPVLIALAQRNQTNYQALSSTVLGYIPGGRRAYKGQLFIKQPRQGRYEDGTTYSANPITLAVSETSSDAKKLIEDFNKALDKISEYEALMAKGTATPAELKALQAEVDDAIEIGTRSQVKNYEDFLSAEKKGKYTRSKASLEADIKGVTPTGDALEVLAESFSDSANAAFSKYGNIFEAKTFKRGDHLIDASGKEAATLSPLDVQQNRLARAVDNATFRQFREQEIQRWLNSFNEYLDLNVLSPTATPMEIIANAKFKPETPNAVRHLAENARDYIKDQLRIGSDFSQARRQRRFERAEWIENLGKDTPFDVYTTKLSNLVREWKHGSPGQWARSIVYYGSFGLFTPATFLQQASAALLILPLAGVRNVGPVLKDTMMLGLRSTARSLDDVAYIRGQLTKDIDADASVSDLVWKAYTESGFDIMDQSFAKMGATDPSHMIRSDLSDFLQKSTVINTSAELMSRKVAASIAVRKALEGNLKPGSKKYEDFVTEYIDKFTFHQTRAGRIWSQRSNASAGRDIIAVATQFMQYSVKAMEAVLPKSLGGSDRFTAKEKLMMSMTGTALFGFAGIPILGAFEEESYTAFNKIARNFGIEVDLNTWNTYSKGLMDTGLSEVVGFETDLGGSSAPANFALERLMDVLSGDTLPETLSGIAGVRAGSILASLGQFYEALRGRSPATPVEAMVDVLGAASRQVGDLKEIYDAYRQGGNRSSKGFFTARTPQEAIYNFMGVIPDDSTKFLAINLLADTKKNENRHLSMLISMHDMYSRAVAEDKFERAAEITGTIAEYMNAIPNKELAYNLRRKAIRIVRSKLQDNPDDTQRLIAKLAEKQQPILD